MEKIRKDYPFATGGPHYPRAIRTGNLLWISGCTAKDTDAVSGTAMEQLKVTLDKIIRIVEAEGGKPEDVVRFVVYVTNMADWAPPSDELLAIWDHYFHGQNPTNSLIGITALASPGLDVEIEVTAVID